MTPAALSPLVSSNEARSGTLAGPTPARQTLLSVSGLSLRYADVQVLRGISFQLQRGEIFGLLGPNGCGKSTTLRILTGLAVPDAGELQLLGEPVAPGGRALRKQMGVVFQAPSLDPRLSVRENLQLTAALWRLPRTTAEQRIAEALAFAQLGERAHSPVKDLSGGMKRRLELARALLHEPKLLLLDEPTSGLDEPSFRRTWERITRLRRETELSVLLTTHRAEEAALCDRVAVIDGGRIVAQDTPEALIAQVAGDVISLEVADPQAIAAQLSSSLDLPAPARIADGRVLIERERGHELIPRLVEALPAGSIRSLSMHRPTLADVFVKLTGRSLGHDQEQAVVAS
jgi:ABC-2 type transport system ATP-binding protein